MAVFYDLQLFADGTLNFDTKIDESGFSGGLGNLGNIFQTGLGVLTGNLMTKAVEGVASIGQKAIQSGSEFESAMAKTSTLFTGTEQEFEALQKTILGISSATGMAASGLANAAYNAESASVPMEQLGAMLEGSAKLAVAGFTDVDTALSATAKTMNAYGQTGEAAMNKIQKVLIQTQNKGITSVGELGASLAQVTPTAAAFGVAFEQVGASLAAMTAQGTPTAQATTQLNSLIAELGKNGTVAAKNLAEAAQGTEYAGMSFSEMMNSGADLSTVLGMLQTSADKSGKKMVDMFSSIEAGKAAMSIFTQNGEIFLEDLAAMSTEADVVGEAYSKMADTFETKSAILQESLANLAISFYSAFNENAGDFVQIGIDAIDTLASGFEEGGAEGLAAAAGTVIANLISAFFESLPSMLSTGVSLIGAFASGITQAVPTIMEAGKSAVSQFVSGAQNNSGELAAVGKSVLDQVCTVITTDLPRLQQQGTDMVGQMAEGILKNAPAAITSAGQVLNQLLEALLTALPQFLNNGTEMIRSLGDGLVQNGPAAFQAMGEVLAQLLATIIEHLPEILEAGIKLIGQLAAGIVQSVGVVIEGIVQIIGKIKDKFSEVDWGDVGRRIVEGIARGLTAAAGAIADAAKNAARQALDSAKSFLGISSPSRVFRDEVGRQIPAGIAEGIDENADMIRFDTVADTMLDNARNTIAGTEFPGITAEGDQGGIDYDQMGEKMKQAMDGVEVRIDGQRAGKILTEPVNHNLKDQSVLEQRGVE